ncbi:TLC domain-containing protein 4-B-like isoform X2 [Branchiostoma floridae x Branchiostoma belcheri]
MALNSGDLICITASFACFVSLYKFVIPAALGRVSKKYNSLPDVRKVCVKERQEVPLLKLAVCILLGYLIADFGIRAANPTSDACDWSMFLHHVLTLYAGHSSAASADLPYYQVLWTLMEIPNIFNCLRVILKELGQKTSLIYVLNGLALTLVTFLTNVAPIPLFWYHMIPLVQSEAFSEVTFGMKVATFVLSPIMHILQCFWFFKVCRGAFEYFFGKTVRKQN